jgi:hypothetical protein
MLFSWLSKLLASMLVAVLSGAIITVVMNQTVLSSHYVEGKLASTNSYVRLSDALNTEIAKKASADAETAQFTAKLQGIITPTVLQTKINGALDGLQAYYRGNGALPTIDLTDLAPQVQAAGIPLPADSPLSKPIQLGSNEKVRGASKTFDHVRLTTIITSLVLIAALLAVSWERHRYAALPDVAITVGGLIAIFALIFGLMPGVISHYVKFDSTSNAFGAIGNDLATSIAHDLAMRFGIIGGLCLVAGIVARIWVGRLQSASAAKPKPTTTLNAKRAPGSLV